MKKLSAYILAIPEIEERQADAQALLQSLEAFSELPVREIFPAVFWKNDQAVADFQASHPNIVFTHEYLAKCRLGQLCATFSHISIWEQLLESDSDGAFVFEDDIYISDVAAFQQILKEILKEIPQHEDIDWLRLHLHKKFRDRVLAIDSPDLFVEDISDWGFASYYLSRTGAKKMLERFARIDDNVDIMIPEMAKKGQLKTMTIKNVVVEHHAFDGDIADLQHRHEKERVQEKLQRTPSTIYSSPHVFANRDLHDQLAGLSNVNIDELRVNGHTILKGVFSRKTVQQSREQVLQNLDVLKNTRPSPSALHLAGFHRFPELESLHTQLASSPIIGRFFDTLLDGEHMQSIGLSDITINRSQCWHKDLLRGKFSTFLGTQEACWGENGGGVYKVLFYLQAGASLKCIRGSHLQPIALESDRSSEPDEHALIDSIQVDEGDVVIMDIRMTHRGASEEFYASGKYDHDQRILVSTAMGGINRPLTRAMEIGNFHRLVDWMERNP